MEDYKFLIYIAISILYFLFKGRKKKPIMRKNTQGGSEGSSSKSGKSFEDIIRELSGESPRQKEEPTFDEAKPLKDQVEERVLDQKVDGEDFENADDTLKELYKKGERLKSINELVDLKEVEQDISRSKLFDEPAEENSFAREIREALSDPDSAKKAIIYAEILNRKY
jgi:hypothetical protein